MVEEKRKNRTMMMLASDTRRPLTMMSNVEGSIETPLTRS